MSSKDKILLILVIGIFLSSIALGITLAILLQTFPTHKDIITKIFPFASIAVGLPFFYLLRKNRK